ncbi:unnamed protein product [Soboliphyme baturini]|uniref:Cytosolic non-specific dipeptidase n=1 Tax=Soboliphyme baturini TaxID=241478 RepID=A0A183J9P9_9BILA|nr:unnamed protein product [Soboliphyme baturini]
MVEFVKNHLEQLGASCEMCYPGIQTMDDGSKVPIAPILFGNLGNDKKKKTVCIYGHLDVQPASKVISNQIYL